MKVTYDPQADILYIRFREGKIEESDEVSEGLIVDYDAQGKPMGIKILDASEVLGGHQEVAIELVRTGIAERIQSEPLMLISQKPILVICGFPLIYSPPGDNRHRLSLSDSQSLFPGKMPPLLLIPSVGESRSGSRSHRRRSR